MSRAGSGRRRLTAALSMGAAGVLLAACNTATAHVTVLGHPSLSIDVPLSLAACTATDSCIALGTSATGTGPSVTGEVRRADGSWVSLRTPNAPSSTLVTASCWRTGCLIGGGSPTGELLWRYRTGSVNLVPLTLTPPSALVTALSCFGVSECVVIDSAGAGADSRLVVTTDGGNSWSTPADLPWGGGGVNTLSCVDTLECLAAVSPSVSSGSAPAPPLLEVTHDGGITWSADPLPPGVERLTSLTCSPHHCDALATSAGGVAWARSGPLGTAWSLHSVSGEPAALACAGDSRCVLVGSIHQAAWLATAHGATLTTRALRYVPSPFSAAACGASLCVATAPSTVASITP